MNRKQLWTIAINIVPIAIAVALLAVAASR